MEKEYSAEQIFDHIDKFIEMYKDGKEVNPIPKDVKVTIYCNYKEKEGFIENTYTKDAGMDLFIARKWILQSELDGLLKNA
jgi:hypothetical protein